MNNIINYDLIVIGGGGCLSKIAKPCANLGYKVAIIEKERLGGTCLNKGCIPSKMLIHPADIAKEIDECSKFNISIPKKQIKFNFMDCVNRVKKVIDDENASIHPENHPNIDVFMGKGSFVDKYKIEIDLNKPDLKNNKKVIISGNQIVIGVGSRPRIPKIKGLENTPYWTSQEALRPTFHPKTLAVIGGGYISTELAHFYGSTGSKIYMFIRSKLLRLLDNETSFEFKKTLLKRKQFKVMEKTLPDEINYDENEKKFIIKYSFNNQQQGEGEGEGEQQILKVDQVLVATGVVPNNDLLNLEKTDIKLRKGGFLEVDEYLKTTQDNVFGIGDCVGNYLFRHSVNFEGEYLMENLFYPEMMKNKKKDKDDDDNDDDDNFEKKKINYIGMPWAVFSNPQIAGVGLTEEQIQKLGIDYVKGLNPYKKSAMGMALRSEDGFVKLLIEKKTRKILGCFIIGDEASIMIHQVIPLMRLNGKLDDLLLMIHVHPAMNEIIRNAARKAKQALIDAGIKIPLSLKFK